MSSRAVKPITNQPTLDLDPFTGVKINHCSIMYDKCFNDRYSYFYIFTCKSFLNIITSKWRKLCRAALMAMTVACNDCNQ